jgi:hypothetical protein
MAPIARLLLNILAGFFVILGIWQVIGLLPVATWLSAPERITSGMWIVLITKLVILGVSILAFKGLRALARKLASPKTLLTPQQSVTARAKQPERQQSRIELRD